MRLRPLVIYICILIGLAGYYFYYEMYLPGLEKGAVDDDHAVSGIDPSGIVQIDITGDDTIVLAGKDESWRLTSPVEKPADAAAIKEIVHAVMAMKPVRSLGDMGSQQDLGLDPPGLSVRLGTEDTDVSLFIGLPTPTGNFVYARSTTRDDIFLIDAFEKEILNKDVFALRDKHVFSMNYQDISRITITRHALILDFVKDDDREWKLTSDSSVRIKSSMIDELLGTLCRLEARGYISEKVPDSAPDISVELSAGDLCQRLLLWQKSYDGENIIALSGIEDSPVLVRDSLVRMIPSDTAEIVDRSIAGIDMPRVKKISVSDGAIQVFAKQGVTWVADGEPIVDNASVETVLASLDGLEYTDQYMKIPDDAQKQWSIQIFYDDSGPAFDIGLYSQYYVALGDQVYQIHEGAMKIVKDSLDVLMHGKR